MALLVGDGTDPAALVEALRRHARVRILLADGSVTEWRKRGCKAHLTPLVLDGRPVVEAITEYGSAVRWFLTSNGVWMDERLSRKPCHLPTTMKEILGSIRRARAIAVPS